MELSLARSASKVADRSQALKCRQHVWEFINKYMEKLNLESEWKLLLNYIAETVVHCPTAFISIPQPSSNVPNQDHEFVLWLFSCLLKLLALPECEGLHQRIAECLDGILRLAKSRDHPLFSCMMEEFIRLASDLTKLDQQWLDNELEFPVYLSHFQFSWGKKDQDECREADGEAGSALGPLDPQLLEAHSPEHVALLFQSVMRLSGRFVDEICQAPPLSVHQLFHALSSSLQFGGLKAKECALVMLEQLLVRKAPVDKPTMDHVVWCFIAVLSVVTRRHFTAEGVPIELETSLASCLNSLFCPREGEPQAVLRFWDPLLSTLQSGLAQGTYPCFCHELQVCIGELLFKCCQLKIEQSKYTADAALQAIGKARDLQPLVACLWYLLHTKLMSKQAPISTEHKEADEITQSRQHNIDSVRKKLSIKGAKAKSAKVLPMALPLLAAVLSQKALQCARQASTLKGIAELRDELLCSLEGVRLVLDVFARVVLSCSERLPCPLLTNEQLGSLCLSWEASLYNVAQHCAGLEDGEKKCLDEVLAIIIDSAGTVTSISDCIPISSVVLDRLLWLVGLPWPKVDKSVPAMEDLVAGSSLSREQCQQIKETSQQLLNRATHSKSCSLKVLAALPQHVGESLKLRGFQQACVDCCEGVHVVLVSTIPAVLTSLEKEMTSSLFASLINMKLETRKLQLILAKELPSILFAVSRNNLPRRFCLGNHYLPIHHTVRLSESAKDFKIDTTSLLPVMEKLITASSPDVVQALIESLSRISPLVEDSSVISSSCIPLFTHERQQVRNTISKHIRLFFPNPNPPATVAELENHPVISKLREAFRMGAKNCNPRLQEFSVISFGQIGKFADGNLLVTCIIALLKLILDPSLAVRAAASVQIHRIAKSQKLIPGKMLSLFKDNVCQFFVELLHQKKGFILKADKKGPFYQVALAFGQKDLRQFFEAIKDVFIPLLVCQATPESSEALKFVAKMTNTSPRSLLVECFKYIFLHLVRNGQQKDLNIASKFLKSEGDFEMTTLLRSDMKNVLNLLLLHLSTHRERVLAGIKMLAEMNQLAGEEKPLQLDSEQQMAEYLQPHLHGVVAFLNFILIRLEYFENSRLSRGKLAIGSLIELMKLMGPCYITQVKMKVLAILRHCLQLGDEEITKLTLSAWNCFIHSVELESLGPLLGQIVVTLSPFANHHPAIVSETFDFLIIQNKDVLGSFFDEIYFMPDVPSLACINTELRKHSYTSKSLQQQLHHVLKGACHERSDVRMDALKALHRLLRSNRAELEKCMVGSDTVDPIITEIVTTLLRGLRGTSFELREEYGRCLGELGAVDPGKLDIPMVSTSKTVKYFEIDGEFAVDLLGELVRAYLASKDTRSQDCCAFAIQEVLRIYDCSNHNPDSDGAQIWSQISPECQEVLIPHLSSSYSATVPRLGKYSIPIFKVSKVVTFHEWIQRWCTRLIHKIPSSFQKDVFLPCSLLFQHDISLALYVLPHVLTCLLRQGSPAVLKEIHTEVMAVLNHSAASKDLEYGDSTNMCTQTVFTAMDHFTAWANGKNKAAAVRKAKGQTQKDNFEEVEKVINFLDSIPKDVLALSAFRCQAYTRALMYLESFLSTNLAALQKNLGFLQKIYVVLDEPDGVAGVAAMKTSEPSLSEQILQYESTGSYRDAAACYERAIQLENEVTHHEGLLRCMMRQGEFTSALMHANGLQVEKPDWMRRLNAFRVEAAWRLGQWSELELYLKNESSSSKKWDVNLGRLLLAAKQKDFEGFLNRLSKVRSGQMGPLSTASLEQGSYQRGYEYIVRLHMLQELEDGVRLLLSLKDHNDAAQNMLSSWQARIELSQESFRTQEPILSLRRVILGLQLGKFKKEIGQYWLQSAKIARRAGHFQTAHSFLLSASAYSLPAFCMEKAEWVQKQGNSHDALLGLQKAVGEQWPQVVINLDGTGESTTRNIIHAEALLLIGRWMEDTAHYDTQTVLKQYKSVISVHPESEDGHFYLGKYYDRLMSVLASDRPTKSGDFLVFIIRHYGHTLEYGSKYIYQSMPRMLTLWLDYGCNVPDGGKKTQEKVALKNMLSTLNDLMAKMVERLPPYQFLIAFSQLISRICHPNSDVFAQLEAIILNLLQHYPQQSLWMMIAVSKSTHPDRQSRCKRILDKAKKNLSHIGNLIDDMVKLSDKLLEVCNKQVDPAKNHSMDKLCRGLTRLTNSSDFSSIMVPLQSSLTVTLPIGHGSNQPNHNPFPGEQPTIIKFEDKVEVLASLQRPKKITAMGSDGDLYVLLCKPKDDLRKDARLMEFNSLVNKCLRKDQDCRQRRLYIRTYAVVPLNEECGLLEWVPHTHGFRNILHKLYQEKGVYVSGRELKDMVKAAQSDPLRLKDVFLNRLLPRHPPVFGEWFLRTFPDPTAWYSSRSSYAHTVAVMSMVGYILGLGDRHGENILFDSTNGDCVHVDFNCLFNRGETFDVPEVVPFRLTHNMIHGLGVTGYEGVFKNSCEVTMKVMRQECEALICVLKTFIHDPLVEWEKVKGKPSCTDTTNEKAVKIVKDIEDRLQGKYPKSKGLPLSVEGQVHALIKDATDVSNLCRMYIGWAAHL